MFVWSRALGCAVLGTALMMGGCEKEETAPAPTRPPGSVPEPTASDATSGMESAADQAGAAAESAGEDVAEAADAAKDQAAAAGDAAADSAADATSEAQKLIEQATQYIKENKWDLAEKTITQLEGMKASLPANLQSQVDNLRPGLNAAKAAADTGIKLPGQ